MFNLGYMQESGLGMPRDLHLAKRSYDQAAETSEDALVPATLALARLHIYFALENWKEFSASSPELMATMEMYGDLFLLALLMVALGLALLVRQRRRLEQVRRQRVQ
jgi:SEL1 protein